MQRDAEYALLVQGSCAALSIIDNAHVVDEPPQATALWCDAPPGTPSIYKVHASAHQLGSFGNGDSPSSADCPGH